jgi:hypothetical protein
MKPDLLQQIRKPTLLVDKEKARKNLKRMAEKAARSISASGRILKPINPRKSGNGFARQAPQP